jgi:hypothetical protein
MCGYAAPKSRGELPLGVQLSSVVVPPVVRSAPPPVLAELPLSVQVSIVNDPVGPLCDYCRTPGSRTRQCKVIPNVEIPGRRIIFLPYLLENVCPRRNYYRVRSRVLVGCNARLAQ